jgi:hypothetical protein
VLQTGVIGRIVHRGVDVLQVRNLAGIQLFQDIQRDHRADHVVAGNDDVIAGIALLQLGQQFFVVGEEVGLNFDTRLLGEGIDCRRADIGVVLEVQRLLLFRESAGGEAGEGQADGRGAFGSFCGSRGEALGLFILEGSPLAARPSGPIGVPIAWLLTGLCRDANH